MSIRSSRLSSTKGFTLVELLIVVAIIGVLASQGVPAYRRMIQKSRKGEAQVMLGNIATAQSGFFSEYGAYGNNIARMGASMDGYKDKDGSNYIYTAGVDLTAACGTNIAAGSVKPTSADVAALGNNPGYNTAVSQTIAGTAVSFTNRMGRLTQAKCKDSALAADFKTYTASATGYIQGGKGSDMDACGAGLTSCDQWTVDQSRTIKNDNDGVL